MRGHSFQAKITWSTRGIGRSMRRAVPEGEDRPGKRVKHEHATPLSGSTRTWAESIVEGTIE
jgi:hypothetical protein